MEYKLSLNSEERRKMDYVCDLYKEGDLDQALPLLEELYKSHPLEPMLTATLANLYWDIKEIEKALELFHKAVKLGPESEKISRGLFHILWEQGDEVGAINEIQRFLDTGGASQEYKEIAVEMNVKRGFGIKI